MSELQSKYRIVVPSMSRPLNVASLVTVLPKPFTIVVRAEQEKDYRKLADPLEVEVHPIAEPVTGIAQTREYIRRVFKEQFIVFSDDDLQDIVCKAGIKSRRYQEPETTRAIIENGVQLLLDLHANLFAWDRQPTQMMIHPERFIRLRAGIAAGAFIVGKGLQFDRNLSTREDVDITLQALAKDRFFLLDQRWYWNFGATWGGAGRNQAVRTSEKEQKDIDYIKRKWGDERYVHFGDNKKAGGGMSLHVPEKNALAIW